VASEGLFIKEENQRPESSRRSREVLWPSDPGEGAGQLALRQQKNPWPSHIGKSGLVSARIACTSNPRSAIPRFDRDRKFLEGQVARIRSIGDSAFGVSSSQGLGVVDSAIREVPKVTEQSGTPET
jgi:hypothetical protein